MSPVTSPVPRGSSNPRGAAERLWSSAASGPAGGGHTLCLLQGQEHVRREKRASPDSVPPDSLLVLAIRLTTPVFPEKPKQFTGEMNPDSCMHHKESRNEMASGGPYVWGSDRSHRLGDGGPNLCSHVPPLQPSTCPSLAGWGNRRSWPVQRQ